MDTIWLSYAELATRLRITPKSARRLVLRNKQWPRQPGNDGQVRVAVPAERLPPADVPDADTVAAPVDVPADTPTDGTDVVRALAALEAHITTLRLTVDILRET